MTSLKVLVRVVIILLFNAIYIELQGQSPNKMGFQAVIKDDSGDLVSNDSVGLRMSILQGGESGTVVYSETHGEMTNEIGLITVEIGGGTVVSGVFADIDWANGPYFFKREIDPAGGTNYVISVTSQFLSIPYAMFANIADTALNIPPSFDGDYNSLTNKPTLPTKTSDLVNDSGFFTSEVDSSITNEIQTISKVDRTVTLSNNGGSFVDSVLTEAQVDAYVNNNGYLTSEVDSSITNEIQAFTVSKTGDTLYLSSSNYVIIPGISLNNNVIKDIDGNTYQTVSIGDQLWFCENLKTTRYNDTTFIPNVTDNTTWSGLTTGARVYYDNDSTQYDTIYGALYNWYAVETGKLCPTGWHVPTDAEWTVLTDYLGGESVAGGKLKEVGTVHWNSLNSHATDEVGFMALPGGVRGEYGPFNYIRNNGTWWSATPSPSNSWGSWRRSMAYNSAAVNRGARDKRQGFSVRCLQD